MKLVLVAGMNPRVNHVGPKVKLAEGWYKLCVENRIDCELILHIEPFGRDLTSQYHEQFQVYDGENVSVEIVKGTEDFINVFAELINGPEPTATS